MKSQKTKIFSIILAFLVITNQAQEVYDGYVLYDGGNTTYLLDTDKQVVHKWENLKRNPYGVYLNDEGNILRPCESDAEGLEWSVSFGSVQEIDKNGDVIWEFTYKNDSVTGHHDIALMPNGNFLLIAYEIKSAEDVMNKGFDSTEYNLMVEQILEVKPPDEGHPEGSIVWKWHIWDHLTTGNEPELFSVNMGIRSSFPPTDGSVEWMHMNGIDYNADLDQILFSSRYFNEIYIIDHSTTISEAAGHTGGNSGMGGDILFRWGSPENYGSTGTRYVAKALHCATWIPNGYPGEGNITTFINSVEDTSGSEDSSSGSRWGNSNSAVYEISPQMKGDFNYETGENLDPVWSYTDLSSQFMSGCQRLPNGNTFICEATTARFLEVNTNGEVVWEYTAVRGENDSVVIPGFDNIMPRATKYGADHPGIQRLLNPTTTKKPYGDQGKISASPVLKFDGRRLQIKNLNENSRLGIYSVSGKKIRSFIIYKARAELDLSSLDQGLYLLKLEYNNCFKNQFVYKM